MRREAYIVALGALVAPATAVSAASCDATGGDPPSVLTMVASKDRTDQAVVVDSSCRIVETITVSNGDFIASTAIQRIESVPSATTSIWWTKDMPLSQGADFSNAKGLMTIIIHSTAIDLGKSKFPSALVQLVIQGATSSSLKSLKLPSGLTSFQYTDGWITTIDSPLPATLTYLGFHGSPISTVQGVMFPDKLAEIWLPYTKLTAIRGAQWPKDLKRLELSGQTISDFEIRESDWPAFNKLGTLTGTFTQTSCREAEAEQRPVLNAMICVITDEKFNKLYRSTSGSPPSPGATSSPSSPSSSSSSSSSSGPKSSEEPDGSNGAGASPKPSNGMGSNSNGGAGVNLTDTSNPFNPNSNGGNASGVNQDGESSTGAGINTTLVAVIVACGVVIALMAAVIVYRAFVARRRKQHLDGATNGTTATTYNSASTPGMSSATAEAAGATPSTAVSNDIREDPLLVKFRIDQTEIVIKGTVARGGHGIISRAAWHGRTVAIKQMLPDSWHRDAVLSSFMDEIRMCAQLDHPRVVAFVGIAWTSLRDLSVVTEFMAGGDLHALLTKQPTPTRPQDWTQPWTSAQIKSKTSIALDIAEAVVYLHSFPRPILHRDLKARNVLLDTEGNAKLSDFGISRVMAVDETMTSEVGTVAWIAPEVLRSERYSERADVYSFGVVLVELDLCQHPYADHMKRLLSESSRRDMYRGSQAMGTLKNTQIAVSVSTGSLRPVPSRGCPSSIASLVSKCVAFDPAMRPTAMQIAYELRQLRRQEEESEHYF